MKKVIKSKRNKVSDNMEALYHTNNPRIKKVIVNSIIDFLKCSRL